jgi:hypothetical protein
MDDLRKHLEIDKNALDQELENQSVLYDKIADLVTEANKSRDVLKERLATVDAELFLEVRSQDSKTKHTEAFIKATVQTDPRHHQAFDNYLKAKFDAEELSNLKDAFGDRSYNIRGLVDLWVRGYYQTTSLTGTEGSQYEFIRQRMAAQRMSK